MQVLSLTLGDLSSALRKLDFKSKLISQANRVLDEVSVQAEFRELPISAEIADGRKNSVNLNIRIDSPTIGSQPDALQVKLLDRIVSRSLEK